MQMLHNSQRRDKRLLDSVLVTLLCSELWEKSPERRQKVSCLERLLHQDKLAEHCRWHEEKPRRAPLGVLSLVGVGEQQGGCPEQKCGWRQSAVVLRTR